MKLRRTHKRGVTLEGIPVGAGHSVLRQRDGPVHPRTARSRSYNKTKTRCPGFTRPNAKLHALRRPFSDPEETLLRSTEGFDRPRRLQESRIDAELASQSIFNEYQRGRPRRCR